MQKRFHSAMQARGDALEAEADAAAAFLEADEVDVDVEGNTDVLRSRRRASISNRPTMTLASPFVITTAPLGASLASSSSRGVHTSALSPSSPSSTPSSRSPSTSARPPAPTAARTRRNSTSALPSASQPLVDLNQPRTRTPYSAVPRERRPPASNPADAASKGESDQVQYEKRRRFRDAQQQDPATTVRPSFGSLPSSSSLH